MRTQENSRDSGKRIGKQKNSEWQANFIRVGKKMAGLHRKVAVGFALRCHRVLFHIARFREG